MLPCFARPRQAREGALGGSRRGGGREKGLVCVGGIGRSIRGRTRPCVCSRLQLALAHKELRALSLSHPLAHTHCVVACEVARDELPFAQQRDAERQVGEPLKRLAIVLVQVCGMRDLTRQNLKTCLRHGASGEEGSLTLSS